MFIVLLIICAAALFAAVLLLLWGIYDLVFGEEDFETPREAVSAIAEEIISAGKGSGVLYDLGSCRGSFARQLQGLLPDATIICIDRTLFRVLYARARSFLMKKRPTFLHGDLFALALDDADAVNIYLPTEMLPDIQKKISRTGGNRIVTLYRISFPAMEPHKSIALPNGEAVSVYRF